MANQVFGDSISNPGVAASPASSAYVPLLASALQTAFTNNAASGAQAADMAIKAQGSALGASEIAVVQIGTNDQWRYNSNTTKQAYYHAFLSHIISQLAAPGRVRGIDSGMQFSGTWTKSVPTWSVGHWSNTLGSSATCQVSGTAVYVSTILQADVSSGPVGGKADVYIDGVKVGTIGSQGTGMTTQNGSSYAPAMYRFGGLSAGTHTVEVRMITNISGSTGVFYLENITGSDQLVKPHVYVGNIPRFSATGYSQKGGSETTTAQFNAIVGDVVQSLSDDGLNVHLVDVESVVNPAADLDTDGVHPINSGHSKMYSTYYVSIAGGLIYTSVPTYIGSDGNYYIGDGVDRRKLVVV